MMFVEALFGKRSSQLEASWLLMDMLQHLVNVHVYGNRCVVVE